MNDKELSLKLDRARWWGLGQQPFYGSLAMGLADVLGNPHSKTACTDGKRIFWDRNFLAKLSDEETRFVLLHETLHCAHGHLWRFPVTDARSNQACDYAVNGVLVGLGDSVSMPKGGLLDKAFDGLAEEEIYSCLPEPPPDNGKDKQDDACGGMTEPAQGQGDGKDGQGKPSEQPGQGDGKGDGDEPGQASASESETLHDQWKERVIQAAQAAKAMGQGKLPADLQRDLDRTLSQKIDWRREMSDFIKDAMALRNDWSRSARRMATEPVIYPRKRRDDLGTIVFVRDTSGSIDDKICAEFNGLIESALGECGCAGVVIDCDAAIQHEQRLAPGESVDPRAHGGGGTDFAEPFARVAQLRDEGERIAGLVYLTDLMGSGQPDSEDVPTLWLCTSDAKANTGRTVKIEV